MKKIKKAVLAALVATTAVTAQAKHGSTQLGFETGAQHGHNSTLENLTMGLQLGYEFKVAPQFSITPVVHGGRSVHGNTLDGEEGKKSRAAVKYYWETGIKFNAYTNANQTSFFYAEPSYKQLRLGTTSKDDGGINFKGIGAKVGFGTFITDHVLVELSAGQHWMKQSDANKRKQNFRNYNLSVSYAL